MITVRLGFSCATAALACCLLCGCPGAPPANHSGNVASDETRAEKSLQWDESSFRPAKPPEMIFRESLAAEIMHRFRNGETALRDDALIAKFLSRYDGRRRLVVVGECGEDTEQDCCEFTLKRLEQDGPVTLATGIVMPLGLELVQACPVPKPDGSVWDRNVIRNFEVQFADIDRKDFDNIYLRPPKAQLATAIIAKALAESGWIENLNDCIYIWLTNKASDEESEGRRGYMICWKTRWEEDDFPIGLWWQEYDFPIGVWAYGYIDMKTLENEASPIM